MSNGKENVKKVIEARRRVLKAMALSIGLSGGVAHAGESQREDFPTDAVEATYQPREDDTENMADFMEVMETSQKKKEIWDYPNADAYADAVGLVYSAKLSNGVNGIGDGENFDGYAGAYINPQKKGTYEEVVFLPNNLQEDYDQVWKCSMAFAKDRQKQGYDMYYHGDHSKYGLCPDRKINILFNRGRGRRPASREHTERRRESNTRNNGRVSSRRTASTNYQYEIDENGKITRSARDNGR